MRRVARLRTQRIRCRTSAWLDRSIQAMIWKLRYDPFGSITAARQKFAAPGGGFFAEVLNTADTILARAILTQEV